MRVRLGVLLGVLFLIGPVSDLGDDSLGSGTRVALGLGVALFVAIYLSVVPPANWIFRRGYSAVIAALVLLPALAVVLLAAGAPDSFTALFVYVTAACGIVLPPRIAIAAIAATTIRIFQV